MGNVWVIDGGFLYEWPGMGLMVGSSALLRLDYFS